MTILGIETATSICGVAIVNEERLIVDRQIDAPNVHSEQLVPMIQQSVKDANLTINDIDAIAVSIGPGSFTGLRIGLSVAKGISFAIEKPVIAVPTLRALADRMKNEQVGSEYGILVAMLPARRGEIYWEAFDGNNIENTKRTASLSSYEEFVEWISQHQPFIAVGNIPAQLEGMMMHLNYQHIKKVSKCSAVAVAQRGIKMFHEKLFVDTSTIEPMYLHEFVAKSVTHM